MMGYITPPVCRVSSPIQMGNHANGKINQPILLPVEVMPYANAFLVVKYCEMIDTAATNMQPVPMPTTTPSVKSTCQYVVDILVNIVPRTLKPAPVYNRDRK